MMVSPNNAGGPGASIVLIDILTADMDNVRRQMAEVVEQQAAIPRINKGSFLTRVENMTRHATLLKRYSALALRHAILLELSAQEFAKLEPK